MEIAIGVYCSLVASIIEGRILMPIRLRHTALTVLCAAACSGAWAGAAVTYVNPEKMTDVPRFESDRKSMEITFREHLEELAKKLPAGQELKVEFLDIDLAGDVFPKVPVRNIRVMKGMADWPRLHLRYSVEQDGSTVLSGERELVNPNYLMGINSYRNEMYSHELQMLDDWFKKDVLTQR